MDVFKSVLLWVAFILSCSSSGKAFQSESHYGDAFGSILKTMNLNDSLELQNLTNLLKSLGLHDCMDNSGHRHKCITAKSLFKFFNITTTDILEETDFGKMASVIVYALLPLNKNESSHNLKKNTNNKRFLTRKVAAYEELLERYATSGLCEQVLDQLLRDINESIGYHLNNPKCFSSNDILHEMNISKKAEITKEKLPELSIVIISKLVSRQCIKIEHEEPLPCPSYFVNDLFNKFSHNNVIEKKKMKELFQNLEIGKPDSTDDDNEEDNDTHNDHNRLRRHISTETSSQTFEAYMESQQQRTGRFRREAIRTAKNIYAKCYSIDEIFSIYHVDEKAGVNLERFQRLSSALLQQIESNVCVKKKRTENVAKKTAPVWGYGLAAVSVISLLSVVMIIPLMKTGFYNRALVFLVSLAVGTLVGDALLHLLPHATGFHNHDSSHNFGQSGLLYVDKDKSYLWKFLAAIGGVYGLFLFETTTRIFSRKKRDKKSSVEQPAQGIEEMNKPGFIKPPPEQTKSPVVLVNIIAKREESSSQIEKSLDGSSFEVREKMEHGKPEIASMAWTIIIGDTIHNIADGIAIGIAFSESVFGGISTSIAVLCHEVPHELGDFVVLLEAGMTVRQALLANFISSWFCFLGLILGKLIGEIEDVNLWILAVTAGFFLYIALTDKLPELMRISDNSDLSRSSILILQNLGIILGFAGMLLLAYFKKDIDFN